VTAEDWVTVAILARPRGRRGELSAIPLCRPERLEQLHQVYLAGSSGEPSRYTLEDAWWHEGRLVVKFEGVDTISDAEQLQGLEIRIPAAERPPLESGEYYQSDLIGCAVIEKASGDSLGVVTNFLESGGPGLLEIGDLLIPFARAICVEINPEQKRIVVDLPEGLKDVNRR
jgi:16S rRNA processing protein RimM